MEKIGDIYKLLLSNSDNQMMPKRIILDLSEGGTFYNTKLYVDIIDKSKSKEYNGYIECKSRPSFIKDFDLVYDHDDKDAEIFTITIPDDEV